MSLHGFGSGVPAGQYLVRIEHVALHGAGMYGEAEFYFKCAQTEVESESIFTPGPNVKIKGFYMGYGSGNLFYMYREWIVSYYAWPQAIESETAFTACYHRLQY
ncbi:uncharacterized protein N7503_003166 [Penicillium pulvis]|uniref:uncharacterized protein n=1 Tax=Penicillium pulvis TaxID=1562058 RepID=UPI00254821F0|nr:uncharacterized protein N7503_003166 [Penicillium pulvis]KAJ5805564.1 hypothetical protein N7503_003166 [Penicillium pulvis]